MKFTSEELAHIEVLIARVEDGVNVAAAPHRPDPLKPSSYAALIVIRRARFRKFGG